MADYTTCRQTLLLYLKARIPFISFRTDERDRALELLRELAGELNIPIAYHTLTQGSRDIASNRVVNEDRSVAGALDYAGQQILKQQNFHFCPDGNPGYRRVTPASRQLLDVASAATERGRSPRCYLNQFRLEQAATARHEHRPRSAQRRRNADHSRGMPSALSRFDADRMERRGYEGSGNRARGRHTGRS